MKTDTKHTPLKVHEDGYYIIDAFGYMFCRAETPGGAEHIVNCVNLHDELIEIVATFHQHHWNDDCEPKMEYDGNLDLCVQVRNLLAKVKP